MNNTNFKNYKLPSSALRTSLNKDSRYYKKNKPTITLKNSSAKYPKQDALSLKEL